MYVVDLDKVTKFSEDLFNIKEFRAALSEALGTENNQGDDSKYGCVHWMSKTKDDDDWWDSWALEYQSSSNFPYAKKGSKVKADWAPDMLCTLYSVYHELEDGSTLPSLKRRDYLGNLLKLQQMLKAVGEGFRKDAFRKAFNSLAKTWKGWTKYYPTYFKENYDFIGYEIPEVNSKKRKR